MESKHLEQFMASVDVENIFELEDSLDQLKDAVIIIQDYLIAVLEIMAMEEGDGAEESEPEGHWMAEPLNEALNDEEE